MFEWWKKLIHGRWRSEPSPPLLHNVWREEGRVLTVERPQCTCLNAQYQETNVRRWPGLRIHTEPQDTSTAAWKHLLQLVEEAAKDGRAEFAPGREMDAAEWATIVTLPPSIAKLKAVKHLILYGSSLMRIPPQIGEMTSLEEFSPYTSYRLHWFPYEITRCQNLKRSS